ncbi:hypothetical protein F4780DRAFT_611723 [Xylariomycetidae sp. FL0641]|nr:hypothetical protein F4780DRAFT_611723 [Xylariomycetidae sp. FL0641]
MFPQNSSRALRRCWRGQRRGPANPVVSHRWPSMNPAVIILLISCWVAVSTAISLGDPPRPTETALLIDTRIPVFANGRWQIMSDDELQQLGRRDQGNLGAQENQEDGSKTNKAATTTAVEINVSTVTTKPTSTTATASPLPSPFDGALAANYSDEQCPKFINSFLANSTFRDCYPVSLLLQSSQSFFEAEKSLVSITQVLNAACAADLDSCTAFLDDLADQLIDSKNCADDYELQNALVVQAYTGMKAYNTVYKATCLTNPETDAYCFANAVTNLTTPSNTYLYRLPLNFSLPKSAAPSCNTCTNETMAIYQSATSDRKSDIANTYESAADQINSVCGNDFVNVTLAAAVDSGAGRSTQQTPPMLLLASFVVMTLCRWLL